MIDIKSFPCRLSLYELVDMDFTGSMYWCSLEATRPKRHARTCTMSWHMRDPHMSMRHRSRLQLVQGMS